MKYGPIRLRKFKEWKHGVFMTALKARARTMRTIARPMLRTERSFDILPLTIMTAKHTGMGSGGDMTSALST